MEPTEDNFVKIAADSQAGLYDLIFVSFTRQIKDSELDRFAIEMTRVNGAERICRVGYEHLGSYQVISQSFFTLNGHQDNFNNLYLQVNEEQIIERVSKDIFETFRSLGIAPVLRVTEDDLLTIKICDKLKQLFVTERFESNLKPLLMLFNRKRDIQGMLYHSWKYLSLIQDIFGVKDN